MFNPQLPRHRHPRRKTRGPRALLQVEHLEARNLLSNVMVNNPAEDGVNRTQSETAIVLGSGSNVVVGFNDSAEYRQGATNHFTGYSLSTDGGTSFTDKGALPNSSKGDVGDPGLARDNTSGAIYLSTIPFSGNGVQVFKSTDNGNSFAAPVTAGKSIGAPDKPWITVDNASGRGQGNVYVTLTSFSGTPRIMFARSLNGGSSWRSPVTIASGTVQGSNVVVGTDHAVYVFWLDGNGSAEQILVKKSTNQGHSFGSAVTVATLRTTGVNGDLGLNGGFRTNTFPQAVVNPANGNLYVVFDDLGQAAGDRSDAYFVESTNGGLTWSSPVKINDDTGTNDQWFPAIAVTPDGNHVGIFWYDRRLDPSNNLIDRFGVVGTVSGSTVTFGTNFRVTDTSFPVVIGNDPNVVSNYMGDYDMAAADNTNFYTAWVDNRLAATAQDVFFTTVTVAGHAPVGASLSSRPGGLLIGLPIQGSAIQVGTWSAGALTAPFSATTNAPISAGPLATSAAQSPAVAPSASPEAAGPLSAVDHLYAAAGGQEQPLALLRLGIDISGTSSTVNRLLSALARVNAERDTFWQGLDAL